MCIEQFIVTLVIHSNLIIEMWQKYAFLSVLSLVFVVMEITCWPNNFLKQLRIHHSVNSYRHKLN
jgi:hypothetical protein